MLRYNLLSHSLTALRGMLDICEKFAYEFDVKFNFLKLTVARISDRFDAKCASLTLDGSDLQ